MSLLPKSEISNFKPASMAVQPDFLSDLVGNPDCWFYHANSQLFSHRQAALCMTELQYM